MQTHSKTVSRQLLRKVITNRHYSFAGLLFLDLSNVILAHFDEPTPFAYILPQTLIGLKVAWDIILPETLVTLKRLEYLCLESRYPEENPLPWEIPNLTNLTHLSLKNVWLDFQQPFLKELKHFSFCFVEGRWTLTST